MFHDTIVVGASITEKSKLSQCNFTKVIINSSIKIKHYRKAEKT